MSIKSTPLPLSSVLANASLEIQVMDILDAISKDAEPGGLTIGRDGDARTLVYTGPVANATDIEVRSIVKPLGFNVSTIRSEKQFELYATRTRENPNP